MAADAAAPAGRATPVPFGISGEALLLALIAAYVLALSVWPLARLFVEALGPGADGEPLGLIREGWQSRASRRAFVNTLTVSLGSVAISAGLGIALALVLGLLDLRRRAAMTFLILSPLLIPSQIMALAWIQLTGASSPVLVPLGLAPAPGTTNPLYSGWGIALLMGIEHMPLVFLAVRASLAALPDDLVEAARIAGAGRARIVLAILMPLTTPAAAAGAILAFAAAVGNFGVPALLGIPGRFPVLTTLIYQQLNGFGPAVLGQVAVLALMLVALAGAALMLRAVFLRHAAIPVERSGRLLRPFELGRLRPAAEALVWALLVVLAVLPLMTLAGTAITPAIGVRLSAATLTLDNFTATLIESRAIRRAFANSFGLALGAALLSVLIALPFAHLATRSRNPLTRALDWLADAPFVVPGTVLALAFILVFLPPLPLIGVSIYGTATILLLAYLARFLPLALRPVATAVAALEPAMDEAARILGIGLGRRILAITAPLAAPSAIAGALLIFMTAFNELTVSALLWSSGVETIGVMIFSLQYEGNSTSAAALSAASVGFVFTLALVLDHLRRHLPPGTLPWRA